MGTCLKVMYSLPTTNLHPKQKSDIDQDVGHAIDKIPIL